MLINFELTKYIIVVPMYLSINNKLSSGLIKNGCFKIFHLKQMMFTELFLWIYKILNLIIYFIKQLFGIYACHTNFNGL